MTARLRTALGAVVVLLLALAGALVTTAPARAAVETIQGVITNPANTAGIPVYLSQELGVAHGRVFDTSMGARVTTTDSTGHFSFGGVTNGDYLVLVAAGDNWVQDISNVQVDGVTDLGTASIALERGRAITGTVRDAAAPHSPLYAILVTAIGSGLSGPFVDWFSYDVDAFSGGGGPVTGSSGTYKVIVPLGDEYMLTAYDPLGRYGMQTWNHRSGCGCDFDEIVVGTGGWPHATAITPRDFDLMAVDEWIYFSVLADHLNGTAKKNLRVFLDQWNGSSWDLGVDQGVTDATGYVELFGEGDGDYRLRYSQGGKFLAVDSWFDFGPGPWPLTDGGKSVVLNGLTTACACATFYEEVDVDLTFANPSTTGGGGSTPTRPPASTPPVVVLPMSADVSPTATPTPTPEPTVDPEPTSGPTDEPEPEPSATATPDPEPVAASAGLPWWLWLLIALLVLGIVTTIIVIVRRR